MEFRILGPLEAREHGEPLALGGRKQRALLGVLLLNPNEVVSSERLIDELWGDRPPQSAIKLIQGYVSNLRKAFRSDPLRTQAPGYLVRVGPGELDLAEFERLVAEARAARQEGATGKASARFRDALALWRGPALADLALEGFARREAERLNEFWLSALIERIELDLALGRHARLVGELEALVARYPLQERLRGLLMLALYRSGRQAEALRVYQQTRSALVEELGLEPSEDLQRLERQILVHDPALDLTDRAVIASPEPEQPAPPAAERERRVRKTVTVVFCDVADSTVLAERLDPETLHNVLSRYHAEAAAVLERHGGTVEKFIGDAVVAFFGVPVVREDDALRAVRATAEIRQSLTALNASLERDFGVSVDIHVGVNTGEVVSAPAGPGHPLATGVAVTIAARLHEAAATGEILLGPTTYRLVADAIRAEPAAPVSIAGRSVGTWRLKDVAGEMVAFSTALAGPFVDREPELADLERLLARAIQERSCQLCTIVGPPGLGKSRLVREFIGTAGESAQVVAGRCLPYGEGITYWPLVEMVKGVAGDEPETWLRDLLRDDAQGALIADGVLGALGLAETAALKEDTFWAFRKLCEALTRDRPLIAIVDDVHWAEPTLLELLEHIASFSSDAPILLLCLARADLLDAAPSWAAPRPNTSLIVLSPLSDEESHALLEGLPSARELPRRTLARAVETAEGNPLFLEQLAAFQADQGTLGDQLAAPPSIQALLAARIDALDPEERRVLECAAVEGRTFHLGAIVELLPTESPAGLQGRLLKLIRKEFIRPDRPTIAGEEAFRFLHTLIRDAAYGSLPKASRAELHEGLVGWVEGRIDGDRTEYDEILGYHLEQAFRYREELGPVDAATRRLASRAAELLASAGHRALARGDVSAATGLLGRAVALLPADDPARLALLPDLGLALTEAGELTRADEVLSDAIETASSVRDRRVEQNARVERAALRLLSDPRSDVDQHIGLVEASLPILERLGEDRGQARAWYLIGLVRGLWRGQCAVAEDALAHALTHVRRAGDKRLEADILNRLAFSAWSGPTPVTEAIGRCQEILAATEGDRTLEAGVLRWVAGLEARRDRFDEARRLIEFASERYEELGMTVMAVAVRAFGCGDIELLADDHAAAERALRRGYEALEQMGEQGYRSSVAAYLARPLYAEGRYEEAERFTVLCESTAADEDTWSQVLFRATRAKVLARRRAYSEAEALAREAVALVGETDLIDLQADTLLDLAEVLRLAGRDEEASESVERALGLYEQKGNVVSAAKARTLLGEAVT